MSGETFKAIARQALSLYLYPVLRIKKLHSYARFRYFSNEPFAHVESALKFLKGLNLQGDFVLVDVGAAKGDSCLRMAHRFNHTKIIAFEPVSEMFELLKLRTLNLPNIFLIKKAISDSQGNHQINITKNFEASSLLEVDWDSANQSEYSAALEFIKDEVVEVSTLDEELINYLKIGLIKFDIQGAELKALRGAKNTLKRTKVVLLEMGNHSCYKSRAKYFEVDHYLRDSGFDLYDFFPSLRDHGKLFEWDAIYVNTSPSL